MAKVKRTAWTAEEYERAARKYERSLPLEHFMEALPQSTQREISLASLAVLRARRADVQVFNELLVQYFFQGKLRQVVPDNMVRLCDEPPQTKGSFNVELEPVQPLLVLEYVSPNSMRKDYKESFAKYGRELKVPNCVMYYPEREDLQVWRHTGEEYERLTANAAGRFAIPELELELGLQDGWVRYWHQGELLPLPAELLRQFDQERQRADQELERANQECQRAHQERERANQEREQRIAAEAELARLRALLAKEETGSASPRRPREQE
ncbi:MAG: Uma2 family endonuclease [Gemmataceae bacterium]|nr:Uma2 family endonuclease [Gemmataceae bacterium]